MQNMKVTCLRSCFNTLLEFQPKKGECNKCSRLLRGAHLLPKWWFGLKWSGTQSGTEQVNAYAVRVRSAPTKPAWICDPPTDVREVLSPGGEMIQQTQNLQKPFFFTSESIASAATKKTTKKSKKKRETDSTSMILCGKHLQNIYSYIKKTIYVHLKFSFFLS